MVVVAGIDVSKATLEVSISEGPVLSFENSADRHSQVAQAYEAYGCDQGGVRVHRWV